MKKNARKESTVISSLKGKTRNSSVISFNTETYEFRVPNRLLLKSKKLQFEVIVAFEEVNKLFKFEKVKKSAGYISFNSPAKSNVFKTALKWLNGLVLSKHPWLHENVCVCYTWPMEVEQQSVLNGKVC